MRGGTVAVLALAALAWCGLAGNAGAKQLALVIGNNTYQEVPPLSTAVNDARAMSAALAAAGYTVETVENGTKRQMSRAIATVESRIAPGDTVLFHYSGHGFEIGGENWLLPVDVPAAKQGEEGLVKDESFNASTVLDRFRDRGAATVVAILDACRDNPFASTGTRSLGGTRGLARMDAAGGQFILFSAGNKELALDRLGPQDHEGTSIFVRSLLPLIGRSDLSLIDLAKETQARVRELAQSVGHNQTPAYYDGIVGRVTITGGQVTKTSAPVETPPPVALGSTRNAQEDVFWQSIQTSRDPAMFQAYLDQVRDGVFAGTYASLARIKLASLAPPPKQEPTPAPTPSPAPQPPSSAAVQACDRAAASADDKDKPAGVAGVADGSIAAGTARQCATAVAEAGAPRRVSWQLYRAYLSEGNAALAIPALRRASDARHPLAMYELGKRLRTGKGVTRNYEDARLLLDRALDAGVAPALVEIAAMYSLGQGARRDYTTAVRLYQLAAKNDVASAYSALGHIYAEGRGVPRNRTKACEFFNEGANRGDADARKAITTICQ